MTQRHRRTSARKFASAVARGKTLAEAAKAAGSRARGRGLSTVGSRMLSNVDVQDALAEIEARRDKALNLDENFELREALFLHAAAIQSGDRQEALRALEFIAKLRQKLVQRTSSQVQVLDEFARGLEQLRAGEADGAA